MTSVETSSFADPVLLTGILGVFRLRLCEVGSDRFRAGAFEALRDRADTDLSDFGHLRVRVPSSASERGWFLAWVFDDGDVVVAEVMDPDETTCAIADLVRWISEALGASIFARDVLTSGIVRNTAMMRRIDLPALARALGNDFAHYDPTKHPACRMTARGHAETYFAFESGKIVVTGCATEKATAELMREARETCARFPKE